jgi:hypothetical protein
MSGGVSNGQLQVDTLLKQEAGVPVHKFDPDASPEEKAAQAGKARQKLASVKPEEPKERGECSLPPPIRLAGSPAISPFFFFFLGTPPVSANTTFSSFRSTELSMAGNNSAPVVPTIVVEDLGDGPKVTAADTQQDAQNIQEDEAAAAVPGALPSKLVGNIPDWYKVGWRHMSGIDKHPLSEEERDKGVLDLFLSEHYYGDWYHNAGIIIFVRIFITLLSFAFMLKAFFTPLGRFGFTFPHKIQFWLGVVVHRACSLQHVL